MITQRNKYIVVLSCGIGGAEKRFLDIFSAMSRTDPSVYFVAPTPLLQKISMAGLSDETRGRIIELPVRYWSAWNVLCSLRRFLKSQPKGMSYHYPLNPLLFAHLGRGDHLSLSLCDCTRVPSFPYGNKNNVLEALAIRMAKKVDVLSPWVFDKLGQLAKTSIRKKLRQTPHGTFVDIMQYTSAPIKQRNVVFLSRMEPQKGIMDWLEVLPSVWQGLKTAPWALETRFLVCGDGSQAESVRHRVAGLATEGIPVAYLGQVEPEPILATSRVILSLQQQTNFPSRVVGEARLSGCTALIRDSGDSREFGHGPGIHYLLAHLDGQQIAELLHTSLAPDAPAYAELSQLICEDARLSYGREDYITYFSSVLSPEPT
ncbi:glycosyltransferase [Neisseriaceae bacterium JH1-16]|nr:glycosyltransferase [Neisseriaceae bacterium JH1-16]